MEQVPPLGGPQNIVHVILMNKQEIKMVCNRARGYGIAMPSVLLS